MTPPGKDDPMRISARGSLVTATAVVALALAGCGASAATTAAASGGGGGGGGGARMDPAQQQKIAQCLQAAGLPVPSFTPRPSRAPGEAPPTRMPGQNRGGGEFADPKVRAALQACGITLPTRAAGRGRWKRRVHRDRLTDHRPPRPTFPAIEPTIERRRLALAMPSASSPAHDRRDSPRRVAPDSPRRFAPTHRAS